MPRAGPAEQVSFYANILIIALGLTGNVIAVQQVAPASKMVGGRRVQLVPDERNGTVTVVLDGKPTLMLTSTTIRLNQDVMNPVWIPANHKTSPCERGR